MKNIISILIVATIALKAGAQNILKSNDAHIRYSGRVSVNEDSAMLSWPGNAVTINFYGSGIKALLRDEKGTNYFKVIVDGLLMPDIQPDTVQQLYTLASGLIKGRHTVQLFKRTEWIFGRTWLYQLQPDPGTKILKAPAAKKRKIEFYGNSITCGYGVLDTSGQDRGTPPFEDNYLSYAAITARHFNAAYSCIARSGIGMLISWFPQVMPEMYDRLYGDENTKWDFSQYTPDVVVINLFQNDSWLIQQPQHEEFKHRFGATPPTDEQIIKAYQHFIATMRSKYPNAYIICALGNMDATKDGSAWPGYISKAVDNMHDNKITAHFFPYKNTPGHPHINEQQAMADDLIKYINETVKW